MRYFATSAKGTEQVLADELAEIGAEHLRRQPGGVAFAGRWEDAWRVCIESRIAVRVLVTLAEFPCKSERDLYDGARSIEWFEHVSPATTLAVSAVGVAPGLDNTMFVAQRTKDAVVDQLRDRTGARPSVDRADPDVAVFVRLARGRASISLDLAGESLHRRGFREDPGAAPLKETLAAALLRLSGWDRTSPLIDPMCGSATLAIEADLWARRVAPGLARERFGFERWASFDASRAKRLAMLRRRASERALERGPAVTASDADADAVRRAKSAVARAGAHVEVRRGRLSELGASDPPGTLIANPPYGHRLGASAELWRELGSALRRLAPGQRVALLLGPNVEFQPPAQAERHRVFNGPLECSFAVWTVS